jgi:hypothetical protein
MQRRLDIHLRARTWRAEVQGGQLETGDVFFRRDGVGCDVHGGLQGGDV